MSSEKPGLLIILSAPSGCGKTTVTNELLRRDSRAVRSVSWTTRAPRPGEKHGKDYFFVTRRQFESARKKRGFLEWAKVYHEFYGTPRDFVESRLACGNDVVLVIDTKGAKQVQRKMSCTSVFLLPPSLEVLKQRLSNRNSDSKKQLAKRLKEVKKEVGQSREYDYRLTNHTVRETVREIKKILRKERNQ